ncbi:MAG: CapA family protein [Clostridia bacterium]|nr:CapA family protein [Clostridia bacterium]
MKYKWIFFLPAVLLLISSSAGLILYFNHQQASQVVTVMKKVEEPKAVSPKAETPLKAPENVAEKGMTEEKKEEKINAEEKKDVLKIIAVGDILLGRGVGSRLEKDKRGYIYPFEKVANFLKEGDVVFANLEEPITASTHGLLGINQGGKYVLKNDVKAFEGIKYAGFNIVNLANNHILDYYDKGLYDTLELLDKNGIVYAGAGKNLNEARKPARIERKNLKIGMLSYTDMSEVLYKGNPPIRFIADKSKAGVAPRNTGYIKEDVDKLRKEADLVIVSLHWGKEESFDVLPEQIELAHTLMDQGVDIILGHHPHQFQGIEIYKGKPIIYSMGNFLFDQNDPENQESFILNMEYTGKRLTAFHARPVKTVDKTQVVPVTGKDAESLLQREVMLSQKLNSKCKIKEDQIEFELP